MNGNRTFSCIAFILSLGFICQCKKSAHPNIHAACFNYSASTVTVYQPDTFSNCSIDTTYFMWCFGDGDTDRSNVSPIHQYIATGVDTVKLFTWKQNGDTAYTWKLVSVITTPANFTGNYHGAETCNLANTDSTGYTVTAIGDTGLIFSNLYNSGKSFKASFTGLNGNIPAQNFAGDSLLLGNFTLSRDTIYLNLIITAFSFRDNCTGIYIKQ